MRFVYHLHACNILQMSIESTKIYQYFDMKIAYLISVHGENF